MTRTRSEYRLTSLNGLPAAEPLSARPPTDADRQALAVLLLDAYRGTIDDEGEGPDEALQAIDEYLGSVDLLSSRVIESFDRLIAMCLVIELEGIVYINTIAVAADEKAKGLGRSLVLTVLHLLGDGGVSEVGAVITDGNEPSERLFTGIGFTRVGSW